MKKLIVLSLHSLLFKKAKLLFSFILLAMLFFSSQSLACSFDTDCKPGSTCLKTNSSIYGICIGGIMPGNQNDRKPVYSPLDINKTYGDTCSFNTDCGPGSVCVKSSYSIYGTCMKGN